MDSKIKTQNFVEDVLIRLAERSLDVFWIRSHDYSEQIYVSPAYETVWGRRVSHLYQYPEEWLSYLLPEDREKLVESIKQRKPTIDSEAKFVESYRIVRPDNTIRWICDTSYPIFAENKLVAFAGIAKDITDYKNYEIKLKEEKERAEIANDAKSKFIANMSHDIRTPLTGILGLAEAIKTSTADKKIVYEAGLLMDSTNELLNLLNEIVEIIKIESDGIIYNCEVFNLRELIAHNLKLLRAAACHHDIELRCEYPDFLPTYFEANKIYLDRILLNLLGNAIKFTKSGHITVHVDVICFNTSSAKATIAVEDTGIGIPKEKFQIIFEHFSRLIPSYQGIYKGSGLGLYMVKKYIESLQGTIDVESTVGKGSTFTVTVPLTLAQQGPRENLQATSSHTPTQANLSHDLDIISVKENSFSVLILEDHPLAAIMVKQLLAQLQCKSYIAANSVEALAYLEKNSCDLIFMDIGLPDENGITITKRIRQLSDSLKANIPIIALTGHISEEKKTICLQAGMQDMLNKPLKLSDAKKILQQYVLKKNDKRISELSQSHEKDMLKS